MGEIVTADIDRIKIRIIIVRIPVFFRFCYGS